MLFNVKDKDAYYVYSYEHVDDLSFIRSPKEYAAGIILEEISEDDVNKAESLVKAKLIESGWEGDGDIGIIWLPPFVLNNPDTFGLYVWHVKQNNNGTSWIASTEPLNYEVLNWQNRENPQGRPVHILELQCERMSERVNEISTNLRSWLHKLDSNEELKQDTAINKILIEHSYCALVQDFQRFLDDCYLVLLQESMTEGNFFKIDLPLPKAKFSIDTNGIEEPHFMKEDVENWLIKQQVISSIWKAFMFEPFKSKVIAIPKSVKFRWDDGLVHHLCTAVVIRNCFQHHSGKLNGDALRVLGKTIDEIAVIVEGKPVKIKKWKEITLHLDEFAALCGSINAAIGTLSAHTNDAIAKRYYVNGEVIHVPDLFR